MNELKLREYQNEAISSIIKEHESGVNSQLIVLPTGTGKTLVAAGIIKHYNKRVLFIAHRDELLQQARSKLLMYWPQADIGICKAAKNDINHQIVIASVQTISRPRRLAQLKAHKFDILLIDESHHASSKTYERIIKEIGASLVVGFTATPSRTDKKKLPFTTTFSRSISTMQAGNYLSKITARRILTGSNINSVKISKGDFDVEELSFQINTNHRNDLIAKTYCKYARDRKAIVFASNVKHAKDLSTAFNARGIKSDYVCGDMKPAKRMATLKKFRDGRITALFNAQLLTEGYDEPSISCIVMASPTKSVTKFTQAIGRGLRPHASKKDCLVLQFSDDYFDINSIVTTKTIMPELDEFIDIADKTINKKEARRKKLIEHEEIILDSEIELLKKTKYLWVDVGEGEWSLASNDCDEIILKPKDNGYIASIYFKNGEERNIIEQPLPFCYAIGSCEDLVNGDLSFSFAVKHNALSSQRATDTQIRFLSQHGVSTLYMDKEAASFAIRTIVAHKNKRRRLLGYEQITDGQSRYLKSLNFETSGLTKDSASKLIQQIIKESVQSQY